MKDIQEGKAAIQSRLEPDEEVKASILCTYNAKMYAHASPYRGILAATDKRLLFYSSLFGSPFFLDIRYDAISSFRREKGLVTRGEHIVVMNAGEREAFQYFNGCDHLDTFIKAVQKLDRLPQHIMHV
ncbi:GRAM domain-containing protein [Bacillus sp. z60-18]|uniref:GRAM domain-containing protein n=1 Tax=Bacillus TaxID=1386 RepID=UPI002117FB73|nr:MULTISPECIES: GRAM domain-containing protein [Bacillus]WFA04899.1 GRAM domain-containing protein [Bacillus sp. HSf4]